MARDKELFELLHEVVSPIREDIARLDKKLDLHIQKTEFGFDKVAETDKEQNRLLQEHHDRSVQLKRDNDLKEVKLRQDFELRLSALEEPKKWRKYNWKIILMLGAGAGGLAAILEVLGHFR